MAILIFIGGFVLGATVGFFAVALIQGASERNRNRGKKKETGEAMP